MLFSLRFLPLHTYWTLECLDILVIFYSEWKSPVFQSFYFLKSYFPCFPTGYLVDPLVDTLVTLSEEFSKWSIAWKTRRKYLSDYAHFLKLCVSKVTLILIGVWVTINRISFFQVDNLNFLISNMKVTHMRELNLDQFGPNHCSTW